MLRTYINISGNIIKHNLRTSMNERTHFFIKICISHILFSMFLWCVRDERRQWQTSTLTQLLLIIAALLPHLGWVCSIGGRWGPQSSVCKVAPTLAFLFPTNSTAAGTCLYSFITPTCFRFFFRLFTQVHLLIDGSVKGQYITPILVEVNNIFYKFFSLKVSFLFIGIFCLVNWEVYSVFRWLTSLTTYHHCGLFNSKAILVEKQKWYYLMEKSIPIYPTPPSGQDMTQGQFLSEV